MKGITHPLGLDCTTEADVCASFDYLVKTTVSILAEKHCAPYGAMCKDDMNQDGRLGLIKAVRCFESDRGCGFAPFAILCIRQEISKGRRRMRRVPRRMDVPGDETYSKWRHEDRVVRRF